MASNNYIDLVRAEIYAGLKEVSNEPVGFIKAVNTSTGAEAAAIGDEIKIPSGTSGEVEDTPVGYSTPTEGNSDVNSEVMKITKSRTVKIDWKGEHQKSARNSGVYDTVFSHQMADAFRKLRNEIERDAYFTSCKGASRAYGTKGTTPFGTSSNMSDLANVKGILDLNGAPKSNRTIVLSPAAEINLLSNQMNMIKVNEAGSDALLRQGIVMPTYGFNVRSSFAGEELTASTEAASYLVNGLAKKGSKEIAIDGGTGDILAGNIISFNGDKNKYVANEGSTLTKLLLNPKGLLKDVADNTAITVDGGYSASVALHRNAVALAIRPPAAPEFNGTKIDTALSREYVTDPLTNITYEIAVYGGQRMLQFQVSVAWGVKAVNGEHIALLLG